VCRGSCVVLGWLACFTLVVSLRFMLDDLSPLVLKCSPLLSGRDLSLSPSLGPALVVRRAACWRRRGREAQQSRRCGGPARPDEESAGEGSPATKGRSFHFLLFLDACCGAVSLSRTCVSNCAVHTPLLIVGCIAFLPVYVHDFIALAVHTCLISLRLLYTRNGNKCAC